ncbi:hypothetical protein [Brytella acorum]|uniref:Uncharacterized protein n=1 Tax=Brytella acorum TaxID=2959299 RepID=A0AA35UGU4_9PROT|nr:hypothetical protein [Brytella acorum]MDF3625088.1 hypothetical protein [Brytella acorum]CAI9121033.1 hypothetical protein LMG32879_001877 [Brytella acorum]
MERDALDRLVAVGFGHAALHLGMKGVQYRPTDALAPMASVYAAPVMAFDRQPGFRFLAPGGWGAISRFVLMDVSDVLTGDILVSGQDTYFVARTDDFRPPLCIQCNRVVTISNVTGTSGNVVASCPAAIEMKGRGEGEKSGMPGSLRPGQFVLLLPSLPGVLLQPYMTVTSDLGTSYTLNAVETSSYGFRCIISMQQV